MPCGIILLWNLNRILGVFGVLFGFCLNGDHLITPCHACYSVLMILCTGLEDCLQDYHFISRSFLDLSK